MSKLKITEGKWKIHGEAQLKDPTGWYHEFKTEQERNAFKDFVDTYQKCGLLPSELLERLTEYDLSENPDSSIKRALIEDKRKLQQQNQELKVSLPKEILKAFQHGRNAGAIFKRAKDSEGLADQYLKERIEALTKEK